MCLCCWQHRLLQGRRPPRGHPAFGQRGPPSRIKAGHQNENSAKEAEDDVNQVQTHCKLLRRWMHRRKIENTKKQYDKNNVNNKQGEAADPTAKPFLSLRVFKAVWLFQRSIGSPVPNSHSTWIIFRMSCSFGHSDANSRFMSVRLEPKRLR